MKGLTYIKIQLKNLFSNFQVSILYFIALPLIIGGAMGFMNKSLHGGEFKLDTIKIGIIDEDKSQLSENLVGFLRNDISKVCKNCSYGLIYDTYTWRGDVYPKCKYYF